jgi:hypothetical protein
MPGKSEERGILVAYGYELLDSDLIVVDDVPVPQGQVEEIKPDTIYDIHRLISELPEPSGLPQPATGGDA